MQDKGIDRKEEKPDSDLEWGCDRGSALEAMAALETGVRQRFLNDEVSVENTKTMLDRIKEAKERCKAGDVSSCEILTDLVEELTQSASETRS